MVNTSKACTVLSRLVKIKDRNHYSLLPSTPKQKVFSTIEKCRSPHFHRRPCSDDILKVMEAVMRIVCMHTYIEQLNYNYYNIIVNSQLTSKQVYSSCYYYNHNNIRMNVSLVMDMQQKLFLLGSIRFQKEM